MNILSFKMVGDYLIHGTEVVPVEITENEIQKEKDKWNSTLSVYIDRINLCGGYIQLTLKNNGTILGKPLGFSDHQLYAEVLDYLNGV